MQGSEKIQGAQCITHTKAVWIFSVTPQIAFFQQAVRMNEYCGGAA
jgi:hypothetical protein